MVKIVVFEIQLDRANGIYFTGEEVSGKVFLRTIEKQKINKIQIEFKGEAYYQQEIGDSSSSDRDTIFETKQYLVQKDENNNDVYVERTEYTFPFKFQLRRSTLPTSYEFYHGETKFYIRYWLKATLNVPWSLNKHAMKFFTVINPLDLNRLPGIKQPYGVSDTKIICCGPCKSDPITIELNTNKTGYVAGEMIIFNATIENRSSETIKSLSAFLVQHLKFISSGSIGCGSPPKHSNDLVTLHYTGEKIGPRKRFNWSNVGLKIPTVCPSFLETCRIGKMEYKLTLVVNVNSFSKNKKLEIPITIGTVPLNDPNITFSANSNFSSDYYNGDGINDMYFKPRYPYYTWRSKDI